MKLLLAPMATLTHQALRLAIHRFGGCDEYFTEMIQAGTLLTGGPFERYYLLAGPEPDKIVWQITGAKADALEKAAELVCGIGGIGVDVNMGCCAPEIVRSGAGIAWMLRPRKEAEEMLRRVGNAVRGAARNSGSPRLSVKLRLGDEDFTEQSFLSFIDMAAAQGVQQITLHPRTRRERYRLPPRYGYVDRLCRHVAEKNHGIKVILNGGIRDRETMRKAVSAAPGADGLMIARAAVQKPWIFAELKGSAPAEIDLLQTALGFIGDLERCQPEEFHRTRLQRFFTYYSDNVKFSHHLRTRLVNNATPDGCRRQLEEYFSQCPEERVVRTTPGKDAGG